MNGLINDEIQYAAINPIHWGLMQLDKKGKVVLLQAYKLVCDILIAVLCAFNCDVTFYISGRFLMYAYTCILTFERSVTDLLYMQGYP